MRERIAELDETDSEGRPLAGSSVAHFINVMHGFYDFRMESADGQQAVIGSLEADRITGECRLLRDMSQEDPDLVTGPITLSRQHWLEPEVPISGRSAELRGPESSRFTAPADTAVPVHFESPYGLAKPSGLGLFTSTATWSEQGMWWHYILPEIAVNPSGHRRRVWRMQVEEGVRVLEVTNAAEWLEFVESYAQFEAGFVFPNWSSVARDYDGVHLTLRAIVAIDGFCFPATGGITAPPYWGLESTLWLRWCFTSSELLEAGT
jgi:hypothetical protein